MPNYKFWDFKISIHQSKAEKVVFNTPLSDIEEKLKYLKEYKFISLKNNKLKLLLKGKLVLNKIVQELLV